MKNKDLHRITQQAIVDLLNESKWEILENFQIITITEDLTTSKDDEKEVEDVIIDSTINRIKYLFNQF